MTLQELSEAISALGFDTARPGTEVLFRAAVTASLQRANRHRPRSGTLTLPHYPVKPIATYASPRRIGTGTGITFTVGGVQSYTVEMTGNATLAAVGGTTAPYQTVNSPLWVRKTGRESGTVTLAFTETAPSYIRNLAFYADAFTPGTVPNWNEVTEYDLRALQSDFGDFAGVILRDGVPYNGKFETADGHILRLPTDATGTYEIPYMLQMPIITASHETDYMLPVDADIASLLPFLCASIIWLDDDPDKAKYYAQLYAAQASELMQSKRPTQTNHYSVNGWG